MGTKLIRLKLLCRAGGFTLVEILISVTVLFIILVALYAVYLTAQNLMTGSLSQSRALLETRKAIDRIEKDVRGCLRSSSVSTDGSQLNLSVVEQNSSHNPVTVQKYFLYTNNSIRYGVSGVERALASNINQLGSNPVFSYDSVQGVVTVNFVSNYSPRRAKTQSLYVTTKIMMRN